MADASSPDDDDDDDVGDFEDVDDCDDYGDCDDLDNHDDYDLLFYLNCGRSIVFCSNRGKHCGIHWSIGAVVHLRIMMMVMMVMRR